MTDNSDKARILDNSDKARLERALVIIKDYRNQVGKLETERNALHKRCQVERRMRYSMPLSKIVWERVLIRAKRWYRRLLKKQILGGDSMGGSGG